MENTISLPMTLVGGPRESELNEKARANSAFPEESSATSVAPTSNTLVFVSLPPRKVE